MRVVLAEKPSVARELASFLGATARRDGYFEGRGYQVVNIDVTVICEAPKIGPHTTAMREKLAGALGIGVKHISVKGKTNEGMGWIGQGEGVAVVATALIATVEG